MTVTRRAARAALGLALAAVVAAALVVPTSAAEPKRQYTAAGNAAAKKVIPRLADLGAGWKSAGSSGPGFATTCASFNPNQSDLTTTGHAEQAFVSSDGLTNAFARVAIFKTAAQAQTSWNRLVRPAFLGCLASNFAAIAPKGTTIKVVSKGKHALAVPGSRHAVYRIVIDVTANGEQVKAYVDAILQGSGTTSTVVLIFALLKAPPASVETKLAAAIAGRLPK